MNRICRLCALAGYSLLAACCLAGEPPSPEHVAGQIDRSLVAELGHRWQPAADETTMLRRVFLDLVGQPPTPDDILAYLADDDPARLQRTIDRLLDDRDFGINWARYWRDVILMRKSEQRAFVVEPALEEFLSEAFNENRDWRQIASAFITAVGDVQLNGATAIIMAQGGKPEGTVAEISRIFCGVQIQCAQCHDHPTDRWTREQFHQLAAFFPRVAVRPGNRNGERTFVVHVTDREFRFRRRPLNNNRFRGTLEHRMPDLEHPEQPGKVMEPVFFVNAQSVPLGTLDAQRRESLARWLTGEENPWFARAFVNRMWAELIGHGFYEPVDDIGPEREAKAPKTLDLLARAFVDSGHDVKWLFRTIMATRVYRQQSQAPADGQECSPAVMSPQRLRADQLLNSLNVALDTSIDELVVPQRRGLGRRLNAVRRLFRAQFEYDPSDPRHEIEGSISQALAMMNSNLATRLLRATPGSPLAAILDANPRDEDAIDEVYLRTLSRFPTAGEVRRSLAYIKESSSRVEAYEDLQWALVNSTEFLFRR